MRGINDATEKLNNEVQGDTKEIVTKNQATFILTGPQSICLATPSVEVYRLSHESSRQGKESHLLVHYVRSNSIAV